MAENNGEQTDIGIEDIVQKLIVDEESYNEYAPMIISFFAEASE